ncbi:hypothetical protein NBRC10512_002423 [Rhodotorula toruloides]|uniref:UDP-N-acetylglucosamine diphosphorylase n=2 Tax=Rhodotorula toruloides TaxID=5286 RepID=A0A061ATZ1_RHOTO|nr:UDP-N-acetylglucosamine pyrophosphorylase [Rhodotorula toruloides NP11]EMS25859.1 UDP-N-acetylglucosamine pyrophosphorylase [Rhodotorula toruloides NP11]CDR38202.1 RHTO0S03e05710g1_1 [Rhodotorula toruloides]
MSAPSTADVQALRSRYEKAGQGHVFTFWDKLSAEEQSTFYRQLLSLDPARINSIHASSLEAEKAAAASTHDEITPPPADQSGSVIGNEKQAAQWNEVGLKAVREGKVAVLLMAGGQGTRLGSSAPKGCYDIGLPSHKSLFQLQAERIKRLQTVAGADKPVPWYVMTSGPTRKPTEEFFAANGFFGLAKENVVFFEQGVLPCLTDDGKIFLDKPGVVAVAPDGNGGVYAALRNPVSPSLSAPTILEDLRQRGVEFIHAYGVDNCLVRVADPVFLGYCISRNADCGAKVVKKTVPTESVGVVALKAGKFAVVEYSEISQEMAERKDASGSDDLAFRAANIANHFYSRQFLEEVSHFDEKQMPYHIARKKVPHIDLASGETVKPSKPNGMKLEQFVFDVFPFTKSFALLEVERKSEFSPLKNAPGTGSDDPETSRRDLLQEQRRWLENAGAKVADGVEVELSPLVSYAGEGLEGVKGLEIKKSGVVHSLDELKQLAA